MDAADLPRPGVIASQPRPQPDPRSNPNGGSAGRPEADAVTVVGIGADGWAGLSAAAQQALRVAEVMFGSRRQLDLVPSHVDVERVEWSIPLLSHLASQLDRAAGRRRVVVASGDPTFYGIAPTISRLRPELALIILPHPSSLSLACARLGWAQQDAEVASLVGRPLARLARLVRAGGRWLVLTGDDGDPAAVAGLLRGRGFGPSRLVALSRLGARDEQWVEGTADQWPATGWPAGTRADQLTVLAVECRPGPGADRIPTVAGLPDDAYENDGQLTKRPVRAITLSSLAPVPGELLWDVGGGAGSIGIEWMRQHPACRAISIERDRDRAARIERNASALGVPDLQVLVAAAPAALLALPRPDAIFVGGGATAEGLLDTCRAALGPGGRLVVNVTTVESEREVLAQHAQHGGELMRIEIAGTTPVGRFTGWRPAMPVLQWVWQAPSP